MVTDIYIIQTIIEIIGLKEQMILKEIGIKSIYQIMHKYKLLAYTDDKYIFQQISEIIGQSQITIIEIGVQLLLIEIEQELHQL